MSLAKETSDDKPEVPTETVLERLRRLIADHPREWISLNDLMGGIGGPRAFGLLLLLLALPNSIPLPSPPGVSTVFGLPMAIFAGQMALGHTRPWLPAFLGKKNLRRESLLKYLDRGQPYLTKLEAYLRPRAIWFVGPIAGRLAGLIMLIMSIILALPIVFGNFLPAFAILLMALALLARDGRMMIAGWIASLLAVALVAFVVFIGIEAIKLAFHSIVY